MDIPDEKSSLTVVKNRSGGDAVEPQRSKPFQAFHEVGGKSHGGLDFHRNESALFPDQEIDLVTVRVAEEIDLRPDPPVERTLDDVRDHKVLVQVAPQGQTKEIIHLKKTNDFVLPLGYTVLRISINIITLIQR